MNKRPVAVYKDCIVTVLDLLGFSKLVDGGAGASEIAEVLDALEQATGLESLEGQLWGESRVALSDSVVHVAEIKPAGNPIGIDFRMLLLSLVHAQAELVYRGIILRGAIARGKVFVDDASGHDGDARIYGPGYQAAYKAETREEFPRLVIAKELVDAIKQGEIGYAKDSPGQFKSDLDDLLSYDTKNKVYCIDYLYMIHHEIDPPEAYCKYLAAHRDLIQTQLAAHAATPRVLRKYVWLAKYHNATLYRFDRKRIYDCCGFDVATLRVAAVPPMPRKKDGCR
jgi:hypothetical protein